MSYHCVMEKNQNTSAPAQGAESESLTVETVKKYLTKDLSIAISCLNAIQSDPDLLEHLAHFMHGRFVNAKHAAKAEA
jgi:hypothetical protein